MYKSFIMSYVRLNENQQECLINSFKDAVEFWGQFDLRKVMASPAKKVDLESNALLRIFASIAPQIQDLVSGQAERDKKLDVMVGIATLTAEKISFMLEEDDILTLGLSEQNNLKEEFRDIIIANTKGLVTILENRFPNGITDDLYERQKPHHAETMMSALMNAARNRNLIPQL